MLIHGFTLSPEAAVSDLLLFQLRTRSGPRAVLDPAQLNVTELISVSWTVILRMACTMGSFSCERMLHLLDQASLIRLFSDQGEVGAHVHKRSMIMYGHVFVYDRCLGTIPYLDVG